MSDLIRDSAIILRTTPFGETSLILTVFTEWHGKIGLMAKGARRKVKTGTALAIEPGYEFEIVWAHKSSRDLQLVREMSLVRSHYGIRQSLLATVIASATIELLLRTQSEDDPHPEIHSAVSHLLSTCESEATTRWPVFWKFHLILLSQLGFAVSEPFESANTSSKLSIESLAVLRKLLSSDFEVAGRLRTSLTAEREITQWLSSYLSLHLHISTHLRSLEALRWVRRIDS